MKLSAGFRVSRSKWASRRFRMRRCCGQLRSWEPAWHRWSAANLPPALRESDRKLFRRRPADDLHEPVGTNPFRKGCAILIGCDCKLLLESPRRLAERQADLSAGKQPAANA